MYEEDM